MADAAQIVEGMGADIVDVNMGCPVPKIAKHNAGCSLMREPEHAADVIRAMARAVKIPVTVKMRAGWNEESINAPVLASRRRRRARPRCGARSHSGAVVHGRVGLESDRACGARITIPVFGSGDCIEAVQIVQRLQDHGVSGVLVGRGALRNPWIFPAAAGARDGVAFAPVSLAERGQFLLDYLDLLLAERVKERTGSGTQRPGRTG